ncbi:hypothetical protein C2845_PM05G16870 [Panicum miliaceum]|uniref:MATH domain-containing protein n=1 Tax=Panicum miliaceum TaxID=4540 RepID=A0A3L6SX45_PANMI|nr:hypothetical protein C2845_PM05G16870 [Panicum miliaceum]
MNPSCSLISETVRAVHKIDGFSALYKEGSSHWLESTRVVDGCEWVVYLYPCHKFVLHKVTLKLVFLGDAGANRLKAHLICLVDPSGSRLPSQEVSVLSASFQRPYDSSRIVPSTFMSYDEIERSGFLNGDSVSIESAITILENPMAIPIPSSNLPQHLGELLESHAGADVTFAVSGESFTTQ